MNDIFYGYCAKVENAEVGSEEAKYYTELALKELEDVFTDIFILSDELMLPIMMDHSSVKYADVYDTEDAAKNDMQKPEYQSAMAIIMPDNSNRINAFYENGFDAIIVHFNGNETAVLPIDAQACEEKLFKNGRLARPDLMVAFRELKNAIKTEDKTLIAEKSNNVYNTFGNNGLYVLRNKATGDVFKPKAVDNGEVVVMTYTDMDAVELSEGVTLAEEDFGEGNVEAVVASLEDIGIPSVSIFINDEYYINKDVVANTILKTPMATRALSYIDKENTKNNIYLDGNDLLIRLLEYPEMYLEFVKGISEGLEFTGKITARTDSYSGRVLFETTTNGNAAAVYSILEKLKSDPDTYLKEFESGKLTY